MKQSLKEFMEQHRHDFDDELPGMHNWTAIEDRKNVSPKRNMRRWIGWAAAILLIFGAGATYFSLTRNRQANFPDAENIVAKPNTTETFGEWPADFAAKARSFYETIEERQRRLKEMTTKQPVLTQQFEGDLAALDSAYQILHRQAQQAPGSEVLIRAMIQNLQLQAELLSKQLQIINEYSNPQKNSHENDKNNSRSI